ncbi:hypothetical protein BpHYR1_009045 [Brachionus plicatilis]|uniref:Uncharacterized protein n=1 Tax=Brachionus plicatilis TaxID=10195 RepID=A0A3M7SVG4_BRAPC|nr:hypothetical protein BpHYR1_009045 [Brachionus plicatilis]
MTQSCPNISLTQFKKPIRDCYLMMHNQGKEYSKIDPTKDLYKFPSEKFFQGSSEWQSLLFSPHGCNMIKICINYMCIIIK